MEYILKASFKQCEIADRQIFKKSKCILPISIGQPVHEGKKFESTINLINRSFQSCVLMIDDSLQRYTLSFYSKKSPDDLWDYANQLGAEWIERNKEYYEKLSIPCKMIRWDHWLAHKDFMFHKENIENNYKNNPQFKNEIDRNVSEYLARHKNTGAIDDEAVINSCILYLIEECAAMCLWTEEQCQFEVYPSGRNSAMKATYEMFISPKFPNLLHSVALRFKKFKQTQKA